VIIGSAIQSLAFYLNHRLKTNYHLNVILIYLLFMFLIIMTLYLVTQIIIDELPSFLNKLQPYLKQFFNLKTSTKNFDIKSQIINILSLTDYLPNILSLLSNFIGGFLSFIFMLVISFYVGLSKNFPESIFSFFRLKEGYFRMWRLIRRQIAFWFLGQIILMISMGFAVYVFTGLILKVKYSILVSLFAGMFEIVPILGPIAVFILTLFIVALENTNYIVPTVIFFISLQQLENHFLVPLVMRKAVSLNPLLIILGILIGAKVGGILGIIIIIPILGSVIEILKIRRIEELTS